MYMYMYMSHCHGKSQGSTLGFPMIHAQVNCMYTHDFITNNVYTIVPSKGISVHIHACTCMYMHVHVHVCTCIFSYMYTCIHCICTIDT